MSEARRAPAGDRQKLRIRHFVSWLLASDFLLLCFLLLDFCLLSSRLLYSVRGGSPMRQWPATRLLGWFAVAPGGGGGSRTVRFGADTAALVRGRRPQAQECRRGAHRPRRDAHRVHGPVEQPDGPARVTDLDLRPRRGHDRAARRRSRLRHQRALVARQQVACVHRPGRRRVRASGAAPGRLAGPRCSARVLSTNHPLPSTGEPPHLVAGEFAHGVSSTGFPARKAPRPTATRWSSRATSTSRARRKA